LLDDARTVGVTGFLLPAVKLDDSELLLDLCRRHADVWCALGVHPHAASTWKDGDTLRLRSLLDEPGVVAVGECGLDFFYDHSPRETQLRVMLEQWDLAWESGLPVIVHNRDSNSEMLAATRRPENRVLKGVFHSFAGGLEMATELLGRGFYLGLSGMVTFPKADNVREVLPTLPQERLLLETDTPYLAPVPHRGEKNQPAFVVETAQRIAAEWELSLGQLSEITTANFFRLFERART